MEAPVPGVLTPAQATCLADATRQSATPSSRRGVSAVVAVECTIGLLEQSGLFNAGRGANRQLDGVQRMDAAIMEGAHLEAGAVASIEGIVHPITAARLVMEETRPCFVSRSVRRQICAARQLQQLDRASFSPACRRRLSYDRILCRTMQKRSTTETGTGPSALSPWIGPGRWRQGPRPEASIRCCQGGLATARSSAVESTRTIRVVLCR